MSTSPEPAFRSLPEHEHRGPEWVCVGPHGLRAGWSVLLAYGIYYFFRLVASTIFLAAGLINERNDYTATSMLTLEMIPLLAMLAAGTIVAVIEQRNILDFNLRGPRPGLHFVSGFGAGFAALSALVVAMCAGGWMRFSPASLAGVESLRYAALWCCTFLAVGCVEEGLFRCYLQFTLTRGINFWWALAAEAGLCVYATLNAQGDSVRGVYAVAALGLIPCLLLHQKSAPRSGSGFWQAAWVSSTWFGMVHTFNSGENSMGVFAAACVGFVFCVSIRVTGSAWWAIGCHTAWDWTETFFYGTADSGIPARGHLLTTTPAGNPLLSGGTDGPEGSILVVGAIALLLGVLLIAHGRRTKPEPTAMQNA